jgi:hypothetical protein
MWIPQLEKQTLLTRIFCQREGEVHFARAKLPMMFPSISTIICQSLRVVVAAVVKLLSTETVLDTSPQKPKSLFRNIMKIFGKSEMVRESIPILRLLTSDCGHSTVPIT